MTTNIRTSHREKMMEAPHAQEAAATSAASTSRIADSERAADTAQRGSPDAALPAGYADAEQLARDMLSAAERGDWQGVVALRRRIPGMARSLHRQWRELRTSDAGNGRALEKARIAAIRRVLVVDDQIRALADASDAQVDRWLRGAAATRTLN
jgi:hypothetical protein